MTTPAGPPQGWYADPNGPTGQQRWWDGEKWTEHMQAPARPAEPVVVAPVQRKTSGCAWATLIAIGVIVVIAIASGSGGSSGGGSSAPSSQSAPPGAPPGAVGGSLSKDCTIKCTSPDAAANLIAGNVYCAWTGGDVHVHATLTNGMNAAVTLSIVPKYFLDKGGQHGTSFGSDIPVKLAAHETKHWIGNAGQPEGVAPGLQITACEPRLEDIDIGG